MGDEAATHWHLMTVTYGGKVSILRNLDAPTARQAYQRLQPDSRPREYINYPEGNLISWAQVRSVRDEGIDKVHILGPEGVDLDPWRGVEPIVVDLSKAA